jgi:F0F1-type ATP synthase membrane subunit c/vacuolar-type H+-ATPase subunit K
MAGLFFFGIYFVGVGVAIGFGAFVATGFGAFVATGFGAFVATGFGAFVATGFAAGIDAAGDGVAAAKLTDAPPINDPATSAVTSTFFIYFLLPN